jgi:hypothetical protein
LRVAQSVVKMVAATVVLRAAMMADAKAERWVGQMAVLMAPQMVGCWVAWTAVGLAARSVALRAQRLVDCLAGKRAQSSVAQTAGKSAVLKARKMAVKMVVR